jgi:hypothetical protein
MCKFATVPRAVGETGITAGLYGTSYILHGNMACNVDTNFGDVSKKERPSKHQRTEANSYQFSNKVGGINLRRTTIIGTN